jgi:transposase
MGKSPKTYTREYKQEAVRLIETSGKPVAQIARELGINDNLLYRWRQEFRREQPSAAGELSVAEMTAEIKRLRRENEVLRQE